MYMGGRFPSDPCKTGETSGCVNCLYQTSSVRPKGTALVRGDLYTHSVVAYS